MKKKYFIKKSYHEHINVVLTINLSYFMLQATYLIFICIISISVLTSCDATSGKRFENDYIVVAGSIYADEPIFDYPIIIGRTSDLVNLNLLNLVASKAIVTITEVESGNNATLSFNMAKMGFIDEHKTFIIAAGKTYRLSVKVDGDEVWAETTVPLTYELIDYESGYTLDSDRDIFPKIAHSEIDLKYPLKIQVPFRNETRLRIEYFCLEDYEDAYFVPPFSDYLGERPNERKDYDGNEYDPGMRKNIETSSLFPNEDNIMTIPFHQFHFWFYGDHSIRINVIDENFYKYRYKSQGYFHGGISQGGIGYFGSVASQTIYTRVIR